MLLKGLGEAFSVIVKLREGWFGALYPAVEGAAPVPQRVVAGEAHAAGAVVAEVGGHVGEAAPDQRGQPARHRAQHRVVPAGSDYVFIMETSGGTETKIFVHQKLVPNQCWLSEKLGFIVLKYCALNHKFAWWILKCLSRVG